MSGGAVHRKRVRRCDREGDAHLLTFSCFSRLELLVDAPVLGLLADAVGRGVSTSGFGLIGFVFMPDHVHLLVWPRHEGSTVRHLLAAIKRPFSYRVKQLWRQTTHPLLALTTVARGDGAAEFRFWQPGGGHDRNLTDPDEVRRALDYLHANPVRRGLCADVADWRWSSWHHWHAEVVPPGLPMVDGWPDQA